LNALKIIGNERKKFNTCYRLRWDTNFRRNVSKNLQRGIFYYSRKIKERGIEIPPELQEHNFLNYCEAVRRYEGFKEIYKNEYSQVLEKYVEELREKEEKSARCLYTQLVTIFVPNDVIILTANLEATSIINRILPEIPREKIIVVDSSAYVEEKKKVLESLKSFGKVLYIADKDEIDGEAAIRAGVDYININFIKNELELSESCSCE